jgi:hypothetical protein
MKSVSFAFYYNSLRSKLQEMQAKSTLSKLNHKHLSTLVFEGCYQTSLILFKIEHTPNATAKAKTTTATLQPLNKYVQLMSNEVAFT